MKIFEVNFMTHELIPPFSQSNTSEYVKANSKEEAIQIARDLSEYDMVSVCFCREIRTIN